MPIELVVLFAGLKNGAETALILAEQHKEEITVDSIYFVSKKQNGARAALRLASKFKGTPNERY